MKKKLLIMFLMASVLFASTGNIGEVYYAQAAGKYPNLVVNEGAGTKFALTPGTTTNVIVPV